MVPSIIHLRFLFAGTWSKPLCLFIHYDKHRRNRYKVPKILGGNGFFLKFVWRKGNVLLKSCPIAIARVLISGTWKTKKRDTEELNVDIVEMSFSC